MDPAEGGNAAGAGSVKPRPRLATGSIGRQWRLPWLTASRMRRLGLPPAGARCPPGGQYGQRAVTFREDARQCPRRSSDRGDAYRVHYFRDKGMPMIIGIVTGVGIFCFSEHERIAVHRPH